MKEKPQKNWEDTEWRKIDKRAEKILSEGIDKRAEEILNGGTELPQREWENIQRKGLEETRKRGRGEISLKMQLSPFP